MKKDQIAQRRKGLWLSFAALGLIGTLVATVPFQSSTKASVTNNDGDDGMNITRSHQPGFENYDIRQDKSAAEKIEAFRAANGKNALQIAVGRSRMVAGEDNLRRRVPTLKVEYNDDLRAPEVIAPDVNRGIHFLTAANSGKRSDVLRRFIKENSDLIGLSDVQADELRVTADYTNPNGDLSYAHLEQSIGGIPVFRGEIKAGFTRRGEMFRIINNLAPQIDYSSVAVNFGNPADAVQAAFKNVSRQLKPEDLARNDAASTDLKVKFGDGDWATTAEKMYFPTEPGVVRAAWRVLEWEPVAAYYVIVDAETGALLWRKNITDDQTQAATYNVYANTTSMAKTLNNPAPLVPGPLDPGLGTQGTLVNRTNVTLIGNEAPNTFNNLGWITDNTNGANGTTDGNAVEAGLDIDGTNGVDAPVSGTGRVFSFVYNPAPGNPAPGDAPTLPAYRNGAVTQLFYINNRYHDELYKLGFTEAARNFQNDNFGRGGVAGDRVSAEAQDSSGTNNANFATPADGGRGRMQMYVFTGPDPDRDGDIDADIVVHEHTHGLSNRLIGNGSGLGNNRGGSMGEGWSDFYGLSLLSNPTDPAQGIYSTGSWATYLLTSSYTYNYYYGIRRFPYALKSFTGGPSNRPHSPQTFADIDPAQISNADGAYPRNPTFSNTATEVHNAGEIWCSALFEVRGKFIARLGGVAGNLKTLQLVTDGMKLTPNSPNFIQARNAILAAAAASSLTPEASADVSDVWAGFAIRGMGFGATDSGSAVVESFNPPNALVNTSGIVVSDAAPGGDGDGFPEPGETLTLTVPVDNNSGGAVNNVTVQVQGGSTATYGTINDGQTVTRTLTYQVPAATPCGSLLTLTFNLNSSAGGPVTSTKDIRIGAPVGGAPVTFSNTAAITINDNAPATPYPSNITVSGLSGNKNIKLTLTGFAHTFPSDVDVLLVGPGGQKFVPMSDAGGTSAVTNVNITLTDTAAAAVPAPVTTGDWKPTNVDTTTDVFPAPAPTAPYNNPAPAGTETFVSTFGTSGATMNGTWSLYVRDDAGIDVGQIAGGWSLTFEANDYNCSVTGGTARTAFDYDGDGRADVSVFRPSSGVWYLNRSTQGFSAAQFGQSGDAIAPGDFDGDGKTDLAVFRSATGVWYRLNSATNTVSTTAFGQSGDVARPGDFDGDGRADIAVFRPSSGVWYRLNSSNGAFAATAFGQSGDVPVVGDFDGDQKTDLTVFRPSTGAWYRLSSNGGAVVTTQFGQSGDVPVAADYDGDTRADIAVFRPATGVWYRLNSNGGGFVATQFGQSGDVAAAADYDGDQRADIAVFRPSNGTWYRLSSNGGAVVTTQFGQSGDVATPNAFNQ